MNFDEQTYGQVASYLNGEMSNDEKKAFEALLEQDEELTSFVNTFLSLDTIYNENTWNVKSNATAAEVKALAEEFRSKDVMALSQKIRAIQQNTTQKTSSEKKRSYFYYISSAVAIAAMFALFYFTFMQSITAYDAFEQYHDWNALPSFQTKSNTNNNLAEAEILFQQKKYREALSIFKKYEQETSTYDPKIQLYIGVAYLELENYHEAIQTFDVLTHSDTVDHHKGYWYTALTYLKQNDTENAKKALEKVLNDSNNFNYEKASKILKKLK